MCISCHLSIEPSKQDVVIKIAAQIVLILITVLIAIYFVLMGGIYG